MTPFIYLDKLVQGFGLRISYGNLYQQPKWVKWTNDELVVSLHGSPSETLTTLTLLTKTEADVWNLPGLPEHADIESLSLWLSECEATLQDFAMHLEALN